MIERAAALELVRQKVATLKVPDGQELVVMDDKTVERAVGWVFFFQSKRFVETGDINDSIVGNGPILVDKRDGSVHQFNTGIHWSKHVEQYEAEHP